MKRSGHPAKSSRGPQGWGLVMVGLEIRARAPRVLKGVVGVPRGLSTPGFYALVTRRTSPSQESCLCSKRTRGRPRHPVGQRTHPGSWGWSALVDHPLRMWLSVGHLGHWQMWPGSLRGPIGASAAATLVERTTRIRG